MNYSSWAPGPPSPPVHFRNFFFLNPLVFLCDPEGFLQRNWVYLSFSRSEIVITELPTHLQRDGN